MKGENPLLKVLRYLPIILVFMSWIATSAVLKYQVMSHDQRISKLEEAREKWVERALSSRRGDK